MINSDELMIVRMPVYNGRIPAITIDSLNKIKGSLSPAVIVCVYGTRNYDDALLELKEIITRNNFISVSAGAFIARHSVFPKVAENRPDESDIRKIGLFAEKTLSILENNYGFDSKNDMVIKGNKPYKIPKSIPLLPKTNKKCNLCGLCARLCPVKAIEVKNPAKTDKGKCIKCGRCIVNCKKEARGYGGLLYFLAGKKFVKANSERKEPELYFI